MVAAYTLKAAFATCHHHSHTHTRHATWKPPLSHTAISHACRQSRAPSSSASATSKAKRGGLEMIRNSAAASRLATTRARRSVKFIRVCRRRSGRQHARREVLRNARAKVTSPFHARVACLEFESRTTGRCARAGMRGCMGYDMCGAGRRTGSGVPQTGDASSRGLRFTGPRRRRCRQHVRGGMSHGPHAHLVCIVCVVYIVCGVCGVYHVCQRLEERCGRDARHMRSGSHVFASRMNHTPHCTRVQARPSTSSTNINVCARAETCSRTLLTPRKQICNRTTLAACAHTSIQTIRLSQRNTHTHTHPATYREHQLPLIALHPRPTHAVRVRTTSTAPHTKHNATPRYRAPFCAARNPHIRRMLRHHPARSHTHASSRASSHACASGGMQRVTHIPCAQKHRACTPATLWLCGTRVSEDACVRLRRHAATDRACIPAHTPHTQACI